MFENIFKRKKLNADKLVKYGFSRVEDKFTLTREISGNDFTLQITIGMDGLPDTSLVENETDSEYVLYKTGAQGAFVGSIRSEIEAILADIAEKCYDPDIFSSAQTVRLIEAVRERYGDEPEFLWEKFPTDAILRRQDSQKWYAVIMTIPVSKLGLPSDETAEIIDLHTRPEQMPELMARENFYPGWHMNKKSWFTLILDGSVPDAELFRLVDESYELAGVRGKPSRPNAK